ncbi:MAG: hypothetical protein IPG10_02550 [Flavobacteriales bacterium]|nr:hypothetical protein [Flavobacteriales bacterium]
MAHFPFWKEYDKELDSDIADMKNLGSDSAGNDHARASSSRVSPPVRTSIWTSPDPPS